MVLPLAIPVAKLGEMLILAGIAYFSTKAVVDNAPAINKAVDSAINSDEAADDADKADAPPIADTCSACQPPEEPPQDDEEKQKQLNERISEEKGKGTVNRDVNSHDEINLNGNIDDANNFFNQLKPDNVKYTSNGVRYGDLSDGSKINVRPYSKSYGNEATVEIQRPNGVKNLKFRYHP